MRSKKAKHNYSLITITLLTMIFVSWKLADIYMQESSTYASIDEAIDTESEIVRLRYFSGGEIDAQGHLQWSYDYEVDLRSSFLTAKGSDPLCGSQRELNQSEMDNLQRHLDNLNYREKRDDESVMLQQFSEVIVLTDSNKESTEIYLTSLGAESGELIATNGVNISDFLQSLHDNQPLQEYCTQQAALLTIKNKFSF